MKYWLPMILILLILPIPASASEIAPPSAPSSAEEYMPERTDSFGNGILELVEKTMISIRPDITEAVKISASLITAITAISILQTLTVKVKDTAALVGTVCITGTLLMNTNAMIHLGSRTITDMTEYGKLLYPVLTAALAAQGGITSSAALYAGTMAITSVLGSLISKTLLPLVYVFLALGTAGSATPEPFLKRLKDIIKTSVSWCLKILLTVFTTYLSITGVVSGTTDAATLKATKVTISSLVPVVGSILSDASESVLVSISLAKNAAGIYGLLATLAIFLSPFFKIALHYILLKITAGVCELIGPKNLTGLIEDFSTAMGLILAMTGSVCLLLLIGTICYMKGAG